MKVKERPISFTTELIPRIMDRTKTQTRRTRGLDMINQSPDGWTIYKSVDGSWVFHRGEIYYELRCPYGSEEELLWIKETYWCDDPSVAQDIISRYEGLYWKATEEHPEIFPKWKSGRFMPKWATRPERLEIIHVQPQRLQEITEEDAKAEGMILVIHEAEMIDALVTPHGVEVRGKIKRSTTRRQAFMELWDRLNGKRYPSTFNPWEWTVEFKLIDPRKEDE